MIRIVADTNVYISALNFGGVAEQVLSLARQHRITLFISLPILQEIEGVLMGPKFQWSAARAREAIVEIGDFAQLVEPTQRISVITADEPDNRILECALEAAADLIVSGDSHLTSLQTFQDIAIVTPRELLYSAGGF